MTKNISGVILCINTDTQCQSTMPWLFHLASSYCSRRLRG